jgi:chaperonin GroES
MFKPIRNNILVKPYPSDEISDGGILVPDTAKEPSHKVHIVSVGTGLPKKPMKLKVGQTGFRVKDWGEPFIIDGELHYLMDQSAIIAIQ